MQYQYLHPQDAFKIGKIKTSKTEVRELIKAWAAISLAFGIVLGGFNNLIFTFILSALTVGIGFLLHELAHKIVAQHYNCWAEFRSNNQMLILAIVMSFFGFVFAAPGAVIIMGEVTRKRNGIISAAGPVTNIILALLFLFLGLIIPITAVKLVFGYGFLINSWLALFNMIPFGNLDGMKILQWDKTAYGIILGASIALMLVQQFLSL